jgi:hypothetical protein
MPAPPLPPPPDGRFLVAFDADWDVWEPTWTRLDSHPNLVTSYTIDRGRQYELDRTDTGRAVVEIIDPDGLLDPTNSSSPYHNKLEPLKQATLGRRNPMTGEWHTRFRGLIEQFDYAYHPSQRVTMLTVQLVDIFDVLSGIEMWPGPKGEATFGDDPPAEIKSPDTVWFDSADYPRTRMNQVLVNAGFDPDPDSPWLVLFSGNVEVWPTSYSTGENVMTVIQDAADAEFPGIGNVYSDRRGRLCFHGRLARFTPIDISAEAGPGRWEFNQWDVGDGTAVRTDPANCAQIREFAYDRGVAKIINHCSVTPQWSNAKNPKGLDLTRAEITGQMVQNAASIKKRGYRSQSFQGLQTRAGKLAGAPGNSLVETKRYAKFYVDNYAVPHNRVTAIGFRSIGISTVGAGITWDLLTRLDISDTMTVTVDAAGGGGFLLEPFYVEGVHEDARMLTPDMDDVTMHLDLSPAAVYGSIPPGWLPA